MSHAICVRRCETATLDDVVSALDDALTQASLRRHSDYVSRVWVLCTPHFSSMMADVAQAAVTKTQCMNVWGGCVSGLVVDGEVTGHEPAIAVAVFGHAFETAGHEGQPFDSIRLQLSEHDPSAHTVDVAQLNEPGTVVHNADCLGMLSYGANYAKMPRLHHGRLAGDHLADTVLRVSNPLVLNSEGLEFLTDPQVVEESNGLFLIQINGLPAAHALRCPAEQTKPVGLRLQVFHAHGESWVPVMEIHADGTLGLAAPVVKGQRVRLARRTAQAIEREIPDWKTAAAKRFNNQPPAIGVLFAGFERSALCHETDQDIAAVLAAFPDTQWFGALGQAAWLNDGATLLTPPRNNRLSICLFNADHV
ncbi:hypothetical protein NQT62_07905 [Limnobacter humi]|uniref:FIST C-domain domain-containing protein n=1 Tax=Limnobacter humi TaxID=1778671 RepID=A0ABT1WFR3_9BURK|nr:hypothetical protein [Limnobacter humi]MCQ8896356.1 hypothetical protein [Limnobacter humi]